ncbi:MAG: MATE family efflux transporter [Candidatus Avilachnospira sp.]|jgi:putative MATE family efflux protein
MNKKNQASLSNQIIEGDITKQLLIFFFPILFGTFFQQLYNTTDAVIVGKFVGKEALAAVGGSTATIINLLVGFFVGISSGASVIISQYYGSGNRGKLTLSVHTSIALAVIGGAVMMVIGIIGAPWALKAMGTPADIMEDSLTYMRIYMLGMIPSMLYNMGSGILRAVGDSGRPLYFLMAACGVNIVLDLFFVVALDMGVMGVGIATTMSQVASALLTVMVLLRTKEAYKVTPKRVFPHLRYLRIILRIGLPAGLQSAMYSISNLVIQAAINVYGTDAVAAWTAYGKVDNIFWMIMSAFGIAITTFAGQNFGAGKKDRVRKSVRICLIMSALTSVAFSFIVISFGSTVLRLFTDDPSVISISMRMIAVISPAYISYVCIEILSGACRGCGDALMPMILTCFGVCVLRILWIFTAERISPGLETISFSYPLTWSVTSIMFIIYYKTRKQLRD